MRSVYRPKPRQKNFQSTAKASVAVSDKQQEEKEADVLDSDHSEVNNENDTIDTNSCRANEQTRLAANATLSRTGALCSADLPPLTRCSSSSSSSSSNGSAVSACASSSSAQSFLSALRRQVAKGVDVCAIRDKSGETILMRACRRGDLSIITFLLSSSSSLHLCLRNSAGYSALQISARGYHYEAVEALLAEGDDWMDIWDADKKQIRDDICGRGKDERKIKVQKAMQRGLEKLKAKLKQKLMEFTWNDEMSLTPTSTACHSSDSSNRSSARFLAEVLVDIIVEYSATIL